MVEKFKGIAIVLASVFMVLIVVLITVIGQRDRELALRKPPTLQDLDRIEERFESPTINAPQETEHIVLVGSLELTKDTADAFPMRLENRPSPAMLATRFKATNAERLLKDKVKIGILKVYDSVPWVFGNKSRSSAYLLGRRMMRTGNWEAARRYFWEALEDPSMSSVVRRNVYAELAWLEENPEMAARLLDLSCMEDKYGSRLRKAISLCQETGSYTLADHYLTRLYAEHLEVAQQWYGDNPMKVTQGE